ncbi:TPA: hypothetical protein U2C46_002132 [Streptococcus suis]|nr:hypothetical protein [Streptococcus suis]
MSLGTFKIPVEEYYSKSRSFRDKVEELRDDVEDNFIRLVSSNIGSLDSRDQNAVEGISAYLKAKQELQILNEHIERLNKMSLEGSGNPLDRVVQLDKEYSVQFKNLGNGASSPQVNQAISSIHYHVEVEQFKYGFTSLVSQLTSGEVTLLANMLNMSDTGFKDWFSSGFHSISTTEEITDLLDKLYTGSGKGISFQTLLYSDEIGVAMRHSRLVEKTLEVMMDLPYILKSQKWAKVATDMLEKPTKFMTNLKMVGNVVGGKYVEAGGTLIKDFIKSDAVKLGGETIAWASLAISGGMNVYSEWNSKKTDSKTVVGKVAKTAIGASIDTVSSIGPLDGMWLGAKLGAVSTNPMVAVGGSLVGLGIGTANLIGDVFFPKEKEAIYDTIKDGAYKLVDLGEQLVENTGKAIESAWNDLKSVGQNVSEFFNNNLEAVNWFG